MYIHLREKWWNFSYDAQKILERLPSVRAKQGLIVGEMSSLGFSLQNDAILTNLTLEVMKSSEIEGESLNLEQVRSSIAKRLGIQTAGLVPLSRYVEGVVEMMLDATQHYQNPINDDRLFGWHNVLFPSGRSGLYTIEVGKYRSGEMQVVSGAMGHEKVHYEAPKPERVPQEMARFISWFNADSGIDPVLKAAIAHLWFVSIHPFDDGNGRIARALTELLLSRADGTAKRFYSMSNQINIDKNAYYDALESVQRADGDITPWVLWFLGCLEKSLDFTSETLSVVLKKAKFWEIHSDKQLNNRQKKLIDMQFDGFFGKLSSSKWAKIAKCSSDTALNDINDLINKGILKKNDEGGRSTSYSLVMLK